jgi:hypothetical protein
MNSRAPKKFKKTKLATAPDYNGSHAHSQPISQTREFFRDDLLRAGDDQHHSGAKRRHMSVSLLDGLDTGLVIGRNGIQSFAPLHCVANRSRITDLS